jgi:hypothetical protein
MMQPAKQKAAPTNSKIANPRCTLENPSINKPMQRPLAEPSSGNPPTKREANK